jgi:hypothetical protein
MSDTFIIIGSKKRRTNVCEARIPEGKLREMYVFCLREGIDPTDMVKDGIQNRYYRLKRIAKGTDEVPEPDPRMPPTVDLKLTVGGEERAVLSGETA